MKKGCTAIELLFSAAILVLSGCSDKRPEPAPKAAVNEVRSQQMAIELLKEKIDWSAPEVSDSRAALSSELLTTNMTVNEIGKEFGRRSPTFEWFATIDKAPGAYFRHPVSYVFLSYSNPKVETLNKERLPSVNGRPVWDSIAAFLGDPNIVHAGSWPERPPIRSGEDALANQFQNWPPRMSVDHCRNEKRAYAVLIHNLDTLESSVETRDNLDVMAAALRANGYAVIEFINNAATGETLPHLNLAAAKGEGIYQLRNFVNVHQDFNDCCEEMLIYLTGETGLDTSGGRSEAYFELPFQMPRPGGHRPTSPRFYADDLAQILSSLKTCHVNVVIDTNNAALFADDLLSIPQVESVTTSCQESEFTYSSALDTLDNGRFYDPYSTADGERGSEFTSSFARGLLNHAIGRSKGSPPTPAATLSKQGFDATRLLDLAYLAGKTTPIARGRVISSNCPCGDDSSTKKN